jgi:hypothetical protein
MDDQTTEERLVRIETKLDFMLDGRKDTEDRLRVLERRDAYVAGICALIAFAAPYLLKKLGL